MKRLFAKFYLWLHGYCTKHGTPKALVPCPPYTYLYCEACDAEREEKIDRRLVTALDELGRTPD